MAQGDGTHRRPVRAKLRAAIAKEAGDTVHVRIDERIGYVQRFRLRAREGRLPAEARPRVVRVR